MKRGQRAPQTRPETRRHPRPREHQRDPGQLQRGDRPRDQRRDTAGRRGAAPRPEGALTTVGSRGRQSALSSTVDVVEDRFLRPTLLSELCQPALGHESVMQRLRAGVSLFQLVIGWTDELGQMKWPGEEVLPLRREMTAPGDRWFVSRRALGSAHHCDGAGGVLLETEPRSRRLIRRGPLGPREHPSGRYVIRQTVHRVSRSNSGGRVDTGSPSSKGVHEHSRRGDDQRSVGPPLPRRSTRSACGPRSL